MKARLKTPDVAQKKGFGFVKTTIKKLLKEDILEPTSFFYDSEFDYGGEEGKMPLMFIGEVPTIWKKYVKTNKTSKTLAAGRCKFDTKTSELLLEVSVGKGGKNAVLKIVHKMLLKPFAKPKFVGSLENPASEVEDVEVADDAVDATVEDVGLEDLKKEAAELLKEGTDKDGILTGIISNIGPSVKDISKVVVTDKLIADAMDALMAVQTMDLETYIPSLTQWIKAVPASLKDKVADELKKLEDLLKKISQNDKEMSTIATNCENLKKVQNPATSEVPPVDDKASSALQNAFKRLVSQKDSFFNKAEKMFQNFKKVN